VKNNTSVAHTEQEQARGPDPSAQTSLRISRQIGRERSRSTTEPAMTIRMFYSRPRVTAETTE